MFRVESDEQQVHRGKTRGIFPLFLSPQPWNIYRHEGTRNSWNKIFALLNGAGGGTQSVAGSHYGEEGTGASFWGNWNTTRSSTDAHTGGHA
jgi:hypothetical protein